MKFREHRGGLAESMGTTVDVADRAALVDRVRSILQPWGIPIADIDVVVQPYGHDGRIGWDTHIVTVPGYGVVGFTDGVPA